MTPDPDNRTDTVEASRLLKRARRMRIAGWACIYIAIALVAIWYVSTRIEVQISDGTWCRIRIGESNLDAAWRLSDDPKPSPFWNVTRFVRIWPSMSIRYNRPWFDAYFIRGYVYSYSDSHELGGGVRLPIWIMFLLFLLIARIFLAHGIQIQRSVSCRCLSCGYSLKYLSSLRCPECGSSTLSKTVIRPVAVRQRQLGNIYLIVTALGLLVMPARFSLSDSLWARDFATDMAVNTTGAWSIPIGWISFHIPSFLGQKIAGVALAIGVWMAWLHSLKHNRYLHWPVWVHVVVAIGWYTLSAPLLQIAIWLVT